MYFLTWLGALVGGGVLELFRDRVGNRAGVDGRSGGGIRL